MIEALVSQGMLELVPCPEEPVADVPDPAHPGAELSPAQAHAASVLREMLAAGRHQPVLLDGVTGSARRRFISRAVAAALGRSAVKC